MGILNNMSMIMPVFVSQSGTYTIPAGNYAVNCSGASWSITLPDATTALGPVTVTHTGTNLSQVYTLLTQSGQTMYVAGTAYASGNVAAYTAGESFTFIPDASGNWTCTNHDANSGLVNAGTIQISATAAYVFTISSSSVTVGAIYSNNGQNFTVTTTIVSALAITCSGTGTPSASGTLTLVSGTGPATIAFSARVITSVPSFGTTTTNVVTWYRQGMNAVINYNLNQTGSGLATTSGDFIIYFPANMTAASTITPYNGGVGSFLYQNVAAQTAFLPTSGTLNQTTNSNFIMGTVGAFLYSLTSFRVAGTNEGAGGISDGNWGSTYFTLTTAATASNITITVPISGWLP